MNCRKRTIAALTALLGSCGSGPDVDFDDVGVPTPVLVLDAAWVRFAGERRPVEYFLLAMREQVRAAAGDRARLPSVQVQVVEGANGVDERWLSWLRTELLKCRVQRVQFGEP